MYQITGNQLKLFWVTACLLTLGVSAENLFAESNCDQLENIRSQAMGNFEQVKGVYDSEMEWYETTIGLTNGDCHISPDDESSDRNDFVCRWTLGSSELVQQKFLILEARIESCYSKIINGKYDFPSRRGSSRRYETSDGHAIGINENTKDRSGRFRLIFMYEN